MGSVSAKLHCLPSESLGLGARWLDSGPRPRPFHPVAGTNGQAAPGALGSDR